MTLVRDLINAARTTLQEVTTDGVRWTKTELVEYLNDAYRFLVENEPEAFADNSEFECVSGTRQTLPSGSVRLMDIVRNLEGRKLPVRQIEKTVLDRMRPGWHGENATTQQELFVYDDRDPLRFYVYPPAAAGSLLEVVSSRIPEKHILSDYEGGLISVRANDRYYPALLNYILYRCFDKDSDDGGNFTRAQTYLQAAYNSLGVKLENSMRVSPNNPANK